LEGLDDCREIRLESHCRDGTIDRDPDNASGLQPFTSQVELHLAGVPDLDVDSVRCNTASAYVSDLLRPDPADSHPVCSAMLVIVSAMTDLDRLMSASSSAKPSLQSVE
jgi:hypothetical protein